MISIIIPSYNGAAILRKSLDSWSEQSLPDNEFEVIVVDNNSSEDIRSVVNAAKNSVSRETWNVKYVLEKNQGATNARHTGARLAKGDILVFADNDGLYNRDCLKSIKEVFAAMPEVGAVACKIDILWDDEEPEWIKPYLFMLGKLDYGPEMFSGSDIYFNGGLFAIKRSIFEQLHGFNPDLIGGKLIGDGDTGLVMKVWDAGIPIGWAPNAIMQHMQQVNKHGTIEGVALHFYNVGVANSYALFRKNDFKNNFTILKYQMKSFVLYVRKWMQYNILQEKERKRYFSLKQREGELAFFKNLRNQNIRKAVLKKDLYWYGRTEIKKHKRV